MGYVSILTRFTESCGLSIQIHIHYNDRYYAFFAMQSKPAQHWEFNFVFCLSTVVHSCTLVD